MMLPVILAQLPVYMSPLEMGWSDYLEYGVLEGYVWGSGVVPVKMLVENYSRGYLPPDIDVVMVYPTPRGEVRIVLDKELRKEMVEYMEKVDSSCASGQVIGTMVDVEAFLDPLWIPDIRVYGRDGFHSSRVLRKGVDVHLVCYETGERRFLVLYPEYVRRGDVDPLYYETPFPPLYVDMDSLILLKKMLSEDYIGRAMRSSTR